MRCIIFTPILQIRKWRFKELRKLPCVTGRAKIEMGFSLIPQPQEETQAEKEKGRKRREVGGWKRKERREDIRDSEVWKKP